MGHSVAARALTTSRSCRDHIKQPSRARSVRRHAAKTVIEHIIDQLVASSKQVRPSMASFAAQLKDMFIVLVEHVTGYGGRGEQDDQGSSGTGDRLNVVQRSEIRPRSIVDPIISEGSKPQVN